jgi:hypothetical protein
MSKTITYLTQDGRTITAPYGKISNGYAYYPGTGPEGKTCGECVNFIRHEYHNRTYFKCALVKSTHGAATDIRRFSPSCKHFAAPSTPPTTEEK